MTKQPETKGKFKATVTSNSKTLHFDRKGLLAEDINVYATTAANENESSYACYWDDERETYLGDVYSGISNSRQ